MGGVVNPTEDQIYCYIADGHGQKVPDQQWNDDSHHKNSDHSDFKKAIGEKLIYNEHCYHTLNSDANTFIIQQTQIIQKEQIKKDNVTSQTVHYII